VRDARVWAGLLGLEQTVVERVEFDQAAGRVVAHVRARRGQRRRCGRCGRRCGGYDPGAGRRRWRALDLGTVQAEVEADAPRVRCPEHGVVVAAVPWARHGAGHTRYFDAQVAWLAVQASKSAVTALMRIAWRTVGAIVDRVLADLVAGTDELDGLTRIGIDEISYRRGYQYLTIVVCHDTGRLVWAAPGRDRATVRAFFDALGPERTRELTHVSADGALWISDVVTEKAPQAIRCADPFHVVAWATEALDEVRRAAWNTARAGQRPRARNKNAATGAARALKRARWALWKNPDNLTSAQQAKLAWIAANDPRLHRAYLLKEGLRVIFQLPADEAGEALARWLGWAQRCRIPAFVALARRVRAHREPILASIEHDLTNALVESTNTKIRLITRRAYGFAKIEHLIALTKLSLGTFQPALPGR
jgi:transposase